MAYRPGYKRRLNYRKKHNSFGTIILIIILLFIAFNWILPNLITGLGFFNKLTKSNLNKTESIESNSTSAPPVLLIPYEATNSANINISGYASSNSTVKIYLDDQLATSVKTKDDGSFITDSISLSLGSNNIFGKTTDSREQDSLPSKIIKLIYDNEKPTLAVSEPEDGKISKDKKIKVLGKTEPGSTLYVNSQRTITNEDGSFSAEISLTEGENTLSVKTHDKAGNLSEIQRKVTYQP